MTILMRSDKWPPALVSFVAFWLMLGLFSLLGGHFNLASALIFATSSVALGLVLWSRQRRKRARSAGSVSPQTR